MGNAPSSRYENYAYPPHNYRPERSERTKYKKYRPYAGSSYEPEEVPYQSQQGYPQAYAQPAYIQQPYTIQPYTFAGTRVDRVYMTAVLISFIEQMVRRMDMHYHIRCHLRSLKHHHSPYHQQ